MAIIQTKIGDQQGLCAAGAKRGDKALDRVIKCHMLVYCNCPARYKYIVLVRLYIIGYIGRHNKVLLIFQNIL